uniref:Glucosidase 2 subunit beta n=2 Tax=Macrostomum lignano TaxID=282301 RepID=A0A1I8IR25_9PLAT
LQLVAMTTTVFSVSICCCLLAAAAAADSEAGESPRGVPRSKLGLYDPTKPFNCLDGSGTLPWSKVNDDYCDCRDGSDEPGTSACKNGRFFCRNRGHKPKYLLASRVNDGVCDCCDGTDEFDSWTTCADVCWEEGKAAREEAERRHAQLVEGHKVYNTWLQDVEPKLAARRKRLAEIGAELERVQPSKAELESAKKAAEDAEEAAKTEHKKAWEESRERQRAERVFNELDSDSDGRIGLADLQIHPEFDVNADGGVTLDELRQYTEGLDEADFASFQEKIWPNIKTIFKSLKQQQQPAAESAPTAEESTDKEMDEALGEGAQPPPTQPTPQEDQAEAETDSMPDYPAEVQELINKANEAREAYNKANDEASKLTTEKSDLERLVERDYGPSNAFFPMADSGECAEFNDNEYTYKLCPFKESLQIQKASGSSTSLGRFKDWSGPEGDKYSSQEYTDGQGCWNGPNRSTKVRIVCGPKTELLSASEPSRCEYSMELATPAACHAHPTAETVDPEHDELH